MGSSYDKLVAQETLIVEATEAICEAMEPDQQDDSGKVTRKELAKRLDCGKSHVTQLLSGERNLTLRTLADMAGALGRKVTLTLEPIPAEPGGKPAAPDQPKDCGGSGFVTRRARLVDDAGNERPLETTCAGCSHPDCPNRDQAEGD